MDVLKGNEQVMLKNKYKVQQNRALHILRLKIHIQEGILRWACFRKCNNKNINHKIQQYATNL